MLGQKRVQLRPRKYSRRGPDRAHAARSQGAGRLQAAFRIQAAQQPVNVARREGAAAGLAPRPYRSGTSVRRRTRLSKAGSARLRKALYLLAQPALRFNPLLKAFFERLVAAGKTRMAAVGACRRKLLLIADGILKSRVPCSTKTIYDILFASPDPH